MSSGKNQPKHLGTDNEEMKGPNIAVHTVRMYVCLVSRGELLLTAVHTSIDLELCSVTNEMTALLMAYVCIWYTNWSVIIRAIHCHLVHTTVSSEGRSLGRRDRYRRPPHGRTEHR